MMCQWEPLLKCMPPPIREELRRIERDMVREIRLRCGEPMEWVCGSGCKYTDKTVSREELRHIISTASHYSPWTAETMSRGYLAIEGGHRIGLCGTVICQNKNIQGLREVDSICIRLARDIKGIAQPFQNEKGSILIIGAPGWGKTTMLRDLCRLASAHDTTLVVDERGELFPQGFARGKRMDVLSLCPKKEGIEMALRTMCPDIIAVDEITAEEDSEILLHAANCGVRLYATAHASSVEDLRNRTVYQKLLKHGVFSKVICLHKNKSAVLERVKLWQ